jgi:hypothetical protein
MPAHPCQCNCRHRLAFSILFSAGWVGLIVFGCLPAATPPPMDEPQDKGGAADQVIVDDDVSFSGQVLPIFAAHCVVCHAAGRTADRVGITMRLTSEEAYASLIEQVSSQTTDWVRVKPGEPENSLLYEKVSSVAPPVGFRMPLACDPLSAQEVEWIRGWIAQGAAEN